MPLSGVPIRPPYPSDWKVRKVRFASPIFYIRRGLARHGFAPPAAGRRFHVGPESKLHAVAQPVYQCGGKCCISNWMRSSYHPGTLDASGRSSSCPGRNMANDNRRRRAVDPPPTWNRWRCSGDVGARIMVCGRPSFWVEARGSSTPQKQSYLSLVPQDFLTPKRAAVRLRRVFICLRSRV